MREVRYDHPFSWTWTAMCDDCSSHLGTVRSIGLQTAKEGSERIHKETGPLLRPQSLWICRSQKLPSLGASYYEARMSFLTRFLLILIAVHVPCHQTWSVSSALLHSLSKGPSEEHFLQKHLNNTWHVCPESPHPGRESSLVDSGSRDHSLSGQRPQVWVHILSFGSHKNRFCLSFLSLVFLGEMQIKHHVMLTLRSLVYSL